MTSRCELITDYSGFMKLKQQWNELVSSSEVDHVYMKHEWFSEWIKAYDVLDLLSIVTLWKDGQLSAIAPIYRKQFNFKKIRAKGLSFLSSGITPRCNFILNDYSLLDELVDHILKLKDWDVFFNSNMETEIGTTQRYIELLRDRRNKHIFRVDDEDALRSPYVLTEGTWEGYLSSLPKKRQKYLTRMCLKRLEKAESFEFLKITTREQFEGFVPTMFDISAESWKASVNRHLKADSPVGKLYINFTPIGLKHNWVAIYVIKVNGETIGFEYLLSCNNKYTLIRCDYKEGHKYYSPGNNLRIAILKDLYSRKHVSEYDFAGSDYPHKLEWTNKIRKHVTITVGNRNLRGKAILFAKNTILPAFSSLSRRPFLGGREHTD